MTRIEWTPALIDELLTLWKQGLTSYQLAAHFGVSRNSICGKLHRERIKMGHVVVRRREPRNRNPFRKKAMNVPIVVPVSAPPLALGPDESRLASIVDVTGCRWPVKDDPSFVGGIACCNHEQKDGSSYCPYHDHLKTASYSRTLIRQTIRDAIHLYVKAAA